MSATPHGSRPRPAAHITRRYKLPTEPQKRAFEGVPAPRRPAMSVEELMSGDGGSVNVDLLRSHLSVRVRCLIDGPPWASCAHARQRPAELGAAERHVPVRAGHS